MNMLVGEKLSIITSKAQTTRHRILGIVNGDDFQIIYSDTPGILKPAYKLQEAMMKEVKTAFVDADLFLYVTDIFETPEKNKDTIKRLRQKQLPVILIINKIDLDKQNRVEGLSIAWQEALPGAFIIPVSALEGFNTESVFDAILVRVPESPPYFDKESLTDKSERFIVSEIIREKMLMNYQKEVPYSVEVAVESFKESEEIIKIRALLFVERESQKGIVIGHKGSMLKKVGTQARVDIASFFNKKIYLELFVKVKKDWRNKDMDLRQFGYM